MLRHVLARVVQASLSLLVVTAIVFGVTRLTGDPAAAVLPEDATAEQYERVRHQLGLDRPIVVQYVDYLGKVIRGDFGTSIRTRGPVSEVVAGRVPATLELGGAALLLALAIGIPLGLYAGYRRGSTLDRGARLFAVLGQAAPPFWIGLLLVLLVAVRANLLPAGGRGGIDHLILPALTLAWASVAGITRLMRSSILETLESDYVRFHRIKGLSESRVLWRHGLRNAALPTLTFSGILAAGLITGSVVTEVVFVWPGMGQLLVDSIKFRDFPTVQAIVLFFAAVYVVVSLLVDILYTVLNPQLRTS